MDAINPWLDPSEVRRLAERLLTPSLEASLGHAELGFGERFIGFDSASAAPPPPPPPPAPSSPLPQEPPPAPAPAPPAPPAHEAEAEASQEAAAVPAPPLPAETPAPVVEEVAEEASDADLAAEPPPDPGLVTAPLLGDLFLKRIDQFREWMKSQFEASDIFLLDPQGSVLFDETGHGRFHLLAQSLRRNALQTDESSCSAHVEVGSVVLQVVFEETSLGPLLLGTTVSGPLPPPSIAALVRGLHILSSTPLR